MKENTVIDVIYFLVICLICIVIGVIGLYTYSKSNEAFISFLGMLFLVYACISLTYTLMKKDMYDNTQFSVNVGVDIFALFISLCIMVYFGVKSYFNSSSSKSAPLNDW